MEPLAVVRPRDDDEVAATVSTAADLRVPVTSRGAGTSIAGNAVGPGIVLDFSRHMDRIISVDAGTATASAGTAQAT